MQCAIHEAFSTFTVCAGYLCASTNDPIWKVFVTIVFPCLTGQSIRVGFGPLTVGDCCGRQTIERKLLFPKVAVGSAGIAAPPWSVAASGNTTIDVRRTE